MTKDKKKLSRRNCKKRCNRKINEKSTKKMRNVFNSKRWLSRKRNLIRQVGIKNSKE